MQDQRVNLMEQPEIKPGIIVETFSYKVEGEGHFAPSIKYKSVQNVLGCLVMVFAM